MSGAVPHPPREADPPFALFAEGLRRGDDAAWRELLRRYSVRLILLARSRLFSPAMRAEVDPEDVAQAVLASFFRRFRDGGFRLAGWDALWGLLMVMTVYRVCKLDRYLKAGVRDRDRTVPLREEVGGPAEALRDPQPTPLETAELAETVRRWTGGLREDQRRVVELGLQGYDDEAVGRALNRTRARVRQIRGDLMDDLVNLLSHDEPAAAL
jgi:DNA-directed RNA polymerase specialized sigma24 family protein